MDFRYILDDRKIKAKLITLFFVIIIIIIFSFVFNILTEDKFINVNDTIGPKIVRVTTSNSDGIYSTNQKIIINVEFNEEIVVQGDNKPRLLLQLDNKTRYANYIDNGSKTELCFEYSVIKGDNAKRLNYVSEDSLEAMGAVIKDRAGNQSSLIMPLISSDNSLKGTRNIQIVTDEAYPIVTEQKITDEIIKYRITFSKPVRGFTQEDIKVYNGTISNFTEISQGKIYEAYVSKYASTKQTLVINANVCIDTETNIPNSCSVPIPAGFSYCGGTKNSGIVITDSKNLSKQTFYTNGTVDERVVNTPGANMFVWVPIDYINDQSGYIDTSNRDDDNKVIDGRFGKRNYPISDSEENREKYKETIANNILGSIKKYNGFYVGRYEGVYCADESMGSKVSSKNSMGYVGRLNQNDKTSLNALYNYINSSMASQAINKLYKGSLSVIPHLAYSAEYDTLLKWIEESGIDVQYDCSSWGNYYNSSIFAKKESNVKMILDTGTVESNSVKNIYDLAGNLWEITRETGPSNSLGVVRGGCYSSIGYTFPASFKTTLSADSMPICGARPFLCVQ